ncbi:hypothetical protein D3C72_2051750 [compost metagenome]
MLLTLPGASGGKVARPSSAAGSTGSPCLPINAICAAYRSWINSVPCSLSNDGAMSESLPAATAVKACHHWDSWARRRHSNPASAVQARWLARANAGGP